MLPLPLVYYLLGFLVYIFAYEYYQNRIRKYIITLDLLKNLDNIPSTSISTLNKKSFYQIKKELIKYFHFDRIRITFAIDLSASNEWQGRKSFQGQSLHKTQATKIYNPYQKVIHQLGIAFEDIFTSKLEYSCFTFGDSETKDSTYFPLIGTGDEVNSYRYVLDAYLKKIDNVILSGPTSFIPIINQLMTYGVYCQKDFTMLIILTDEFKISHQDKLLVELIHILANLYNICLIIIGVGDGPWERMSYEEHRLRELIFKKLDRKETKNSQIEINQSKIIYDNFHFIDFNSFNTQSNRIDTENNLARAVLTKLPTQFKQTFRHRNENKIL